MSSFRTDFVTIIFRRVAGVRIIRRFRIVGTAFPCRRFLFIGGRVLNAERCLLANGFRIISSRRNTLVFARKIFL
ncbi:hypothetical protein ACFFNY_19330 [Paenibacillus hodogayensis]|uniref:Uncharacterized protein n=1 Tax=Paenibacillus hodogayensis TaxID=279208 RepID=A0ABV5W0E7_9BACL